MEPLFWALPWSWQAGVEAKALPEGPAAEPLPGEACRTGHNQAPSFPRPLLKPFKDSRIKHYFVS